MKALYCVLINLLIMNFYPQLQAQCSDSKSTKCQINQSADSEEVPIRLGCVHKLVLKFAKRPVNASKLWMIYTTYQMQFVAYSEHGPSFMAFSELHEALHNEVGINNFNTQHPLLKTYKEKLTVFLNTLENPEIKSFIYELSKKNNDDYLDSNRYDDFINKAYSTFLISLIQENYQYFEKRFIDHINSNRQLDIIDRAFFCFQPNWPSYEQFFMEHQNSKHQLESLYIMKANNGKIFIASYNERIFNCDSLLRIFKVDITKSPISVTLTMPHTDDPSGIDTLQYPRTGGCAGQPPINAGISFDGNQLKVRGYYYRTLNEFLFDTNTEQWTKLTEKELTMEQIQSIYKELDEKTERSKCYPRPTMLYIFPVWE